MSHALLPTSCALHLAAEVLEMLEARGALASGSERVDRRRVVVEHANVEVWRVLLCELSARFGLTPSADALQDGDLATFGSVFDFVFDCLTGGVTPQENRQSPKMPA